ALPVALGSVLIWGGLLAVRARRGSCDPQGLLAWNRGRAGHVACPSAVPPRLTTVRVARSWVGAPMPRFGSTEPARGVTVLPSAPRCWPVHSASDSRPDEPRYYPS